MIVKYREGAFMNTYGIEAPAFLLKQNIRPAFTELAKLKNPLIRLPLRTKGHSKD